MTKSVRNDSKNKKSGINKNLLAGAITLVILVVVAGLYLDRQGRRGLALARAEATVDLLDEWGRGGASQTRAALGANAAPPALEGVLAGGEVGAVPINQTKAAFNKYIQQTPAPVVQ